MDFPGRQIALVYRRIGELLEANTENQKNAMLAYVTVELYWSVIPRS
jgi:hypothetical protein